jgi:hypothetical protein
MTYQRDPDRDPDLRQTDPDLRQRNYLRRDDGGWGVLPMLLGAAFLLLLGYLVFGPGVDRSATTSTQRTEAPGPATKPPATPPAKPQ